MNQDEIKAEIEKLVVLSAALDEFVTRVATLEAKLAEAEKPEFVKPKHLDYGPYTFEGSPRGIAVYIDLPSTRDLAIYTEEVGFYSSKATKDGRGFTSILGNLDDLKALSKPLKDFDYGDITGKVSEDDPNRICIGGFWHTIKTAKTLSMYIQRLIFTAGQEAAK